MRASCSSFLCRILAIAASTAIFCAVEASATTWSLQDDFSTTLNPNGPWAFGWRQNGTGTFNLLDATWVSGTSTHWYDATQGILPEVFKNNDAPDFGSGILTGQVSLHPGSSGQFAVVEWTSPVAGLLNLSSTFYTGGTAAEIYTITLNGMSIFTSSVQVTSTMSYASAIDVAIGDKLDFIVGGNYFGGATPLLVTIDDTPAPTGVPDESSTILLLGYSLAALGFLRRKFARTDMSRVMNRILLFSLVTCSAVALSNSAHAVPSLQFQYLADSFTINDNDGTDTNANAGIVQWTGNWQGWNFEVKGLSSPAIGTSTSPSMELNVVATGSGGMTIVWTDAFGPVAPGSLHADISGSLQESLGSTLYYFPQLNAVSAFTFGPFANGGLFSASGDTFNAGGSYTMREYVGILHGDTGTTSFSAHLSVPDSGLTITLFGLSLLAMGVLRRFHQRA